MSAVAEMQRKAKDPGTPVSIEAEQALLGIVMYDNSAYASVSYLKPPQFSEGLHQRIWETITARINAGQLADPITLVEAFHADPAFADLGGARYLADLVDRAPPAANASDYATEIAATALRRGLVEFSASIREYIAEAHGYDAATILSNIRRSFDQIEGDAAVDDTTMIAAPEAANRAVQAIEELAASGRPKGRMTGLRCFDRRLGGLKPGALIIVGGRPGMGKTALARAALSGAAVHNPDTTFAFLGIEMGPEEMMQRELSSWTYVEQDPVKYQDMGRGSVTPMEIAAIRMAHRRVPSNLILDDCHSLGVEDVRRKVWSLKRKGPLAAIVIDYLQLMRRPAANGRNETSVIGEMTQALKLLARQASIAIILLSQLSRQVEYRDDKRPQLSDLRESGAIEQDADAVLFPFREYYYVSRVEPKAGGAEHLEWEMKCADLETRLDVICAKQRQGPIGTDRQVYRAEFDHIEDWRE